MNNCIRTNLFSAFDCIWLLERLPQVSAQREHTIVLSGTNNLKSVRFFKLVLQYDYSIVFYMFLACTMQ